MRIFLSLFFVAGFVLAAYSIWSFAVAIQTRSWPATTAVVVSDACKRGTTNTAARRTEYRYSVGGQSYASMQRQPGITISSTGCVASLRPGERLTAYYDPEQPARAVLVRGQTRESLFGLLIGGAFMAFGLFALRRFRRR